MMARQSRARGVLSNAGWNAFGTLFNIAISFLMAPVLIRHLGTDQWGLLLLVWSVTGVLGMANFGMGEAALRFIARYHADGDLAGVNRVLGAILTFYVFICALVSAIFLAATPVVAQWVKVPEGGHYSVDGLLRLAALLFSLGMIADAFRSIPQAMHRYDISNRIGLGQSVVRSLGVILLVVAGMGAVHVVLWDVLIAAIMLGVHIRVARHLVPGVRWLPSMSVSTLREIVGYGVLSFLTYIFLMVYRESGKLILGNRLGTASVAYLGTPESVAVRLHMIVINGIETLVPRFSASRDPEHAKALLTTSTWTAVTCGVVLYLPLAVLMPDFLRLWINAEFASEGGSVGRLIALSFIASVGFAPIAALLRGIGKPGFVTLVMALAGTIVLASTLALVSSHGAVAAGYGYVLASIAWLGGLLVGWIRLYKLHSLGLLARVAGLPLMLGCGLGAGQIVFRSWWGEPGWFGMLIMGAVFAGVNAVTLFGVDRVLGGASPGEQVLRRVLGSGRLIALRRRFGVA